MPIRKVDFQGPHSRHPVPEFLHPGTPCSGTDVIAKNGSGGPGWWRPTDEATGRPPATGDRKQCMCRFAAVG